MKFLLAFACLVAAVAAYPQQGAGGALTQDAIRQAQSSQLIPRDATIQKVDQGIELGAYESIPGGQRIDLGEILGDQVPRDVINNLQIQIDQIGRN